MDVVFNSALDFNKISTSYAISQSVQIKNTWDLETANSIHQCLATEIDYDYVYSSNGKSFEASEQKLTNLPENELKQFTHELYGNASKGIGFFYGRQIIKAEKVAQPKILRDVLSYLNSEALLQNMREVSGFDDISKASAEATRYIPGNFLTRQGGQSLNENRKLGFALSFTPEWHPDWGGLLQFYQEDGTPREACSPVFNSMALFDVSHIHAVTYVAPYAPTPRYVISGFFISD